MTMKLIAQIRNAPEVKIDLVYDDSIRVDGHEHVFVLRKWEVDVLTDRVETDYISLTPPEFIALLKEGLAYYEINGDAVRKLGLQVVK